MLGCVRHAFALVFTFLWSQGRWLVATNAKVNTPEPRRRHWRTHLCSHLPTHTSTVQAPVCASHAPLSCSSMSFRTRHVLEFALPPPPHCTCIARAHHSHLLHMRVRRQKSQCKEGGKGGEVDGRACRLPANVKSSMFDSNEDERQTRDRSRRETEDRTRTRRKKGGGGGWDYLGVD